jgi:cholesterol oxidase
LGRFINSVSHPFDVIIIGSGFGGAVHACRAAEAGARVLVLERGRRWDSASYPRGLAGPWFYDVRRPHRKNGWLDLRCFLGMTVAQGAGVGGGSLCYSSVALEATPDLFSVGWPAEITFAELQPHYASARAMLGARTIPDSQWTQRYKLLREAAQKTGRFDQFASAPLAVSFDPQWNYGLPDALDKIHTKPFRNPQGRWQGTCVHLGECDIGCTVQAKNTLDLNYIAQAERHGAEVRPLHIVRFVEREEEGYRVHFDQLHSGRLLPGTVSAPKVVLAAGSLGSTELLLRSRDEFRALPHVSRQLGNGWSSNANVLTPAIYENSSRVRQSIGPTISAVLDLMNGQIDGHPLVVEDDGFPNLLVNALRDDFARRWLSPIVWQAGRTLRRSVDENNPFGHVMVWLGAGYDAADGRLQLQRRWSKPWTRRLALDWKVKNSTPVIEAILKVHRELTEATGGKLRVPAWWRWFRSLVTVHPLGGCRVGSDATDGVVAHDGQVFGYPGLYVSDGAIFPRSAGRNPSLTIAALAERSAQLMWS